MRTSDFNQLVVKMYILDFKFVLQVDKTSVMDLYPRKPQVRNQNRAKINTETFPQRRISVYVSSFQE